MAVVVRCRLEAAAQALSGGGSEEMLTRLSLLHAKAVKAHIDVSQLAIEDRASLSSEISALPWRGGDRDSVMDSLLEKVDAPSKACRKETSKMQDLR